MPLYDNALYLIRANLEEIQRGGRVRAVVIGRLTDAQHKAVNEDRAAAGLPALEDPEVMFIGKHIYDSGSRGTGTPPTMSSRRSRA